MVKKLISILFLLMPNSSLFCMEGKGDSVSKLLDMLTTHQKNIQEHREYKEEKKNPCRLKIYSSHGGGGHDSVDQALHQYLGNNNDVETTQAFTETLAELDPTKTVTSFTGEDVYNYLLKNKQNLAVSIMQKMGNWWYQKNEDRAIQLIVSEIERSKPNIIISIIPVINGILLKAAIKTNTPIIIIPTDLDPSMALAGINNPRYKKLRIILPFSHQKALNVLQSQNIDMSYVRYTGFPLRKNFLYFPDSQELQKYKDLKNGKPTIFLMMGKQGTNDTYDIVMQLAKLTKKVHLFVVMGNAEETDKKRVQKISHSQNVTKTIFGYVDPAPLMIISHLIISKSGTVSVMEAMKLKKILLLIHTSSVPNWEEDNHTFIEKHGLGKSIKRLDCLNEYVEEFLRQKKVLQVQDNYKKLDLGKPETKIPNEINQMVQEFSDQHNSDDKNS